MDVSFLKRHLPKIKSKQEYYELPFEYFEKHPMKVSTMPIVRVLIVTLPCNGFGDIVFGYKLHVLLKQWFGSRVRVTIATTNVPAFMQIGESAKSLVYLTHTGAKTKDTECVKITGIKGYNAEAFISKHKLVPESLDKYDLYLVAPVIIGEKPSFEALQRTFKNSNRFNTFFFTEYNAPLNDDILFQTGVGKNRMGLLFVDDGRKPSKKLNLRYPYSIMYIAKLDDKRDVTHCYVGFLELLTNKYHLNRLDVVAPGWMKDFILDDEDRIIDVVHSHYQRISIITDKNEKIYLFNDKKSGKANELVFRFDVLPLPFNTMKELYKHSLPHALLTGDQSITDFLYFRRHEHSYPFYQAVPWKKDFYTSLARELPQKFLKTKKTSCGNISAVSYKPNVKPFIEDNNFAENAKSLLQAVVFSVADKSKASQLYKKAVLAADKGKGKKVDTAIIKEALQKVK